MLWSLHESGFCLSTLKVIESYLQRSWHNCMNFTTFTTRFGEEKPFRKNTMFHFSHVFFSAKSQGFFEDKFWPSERGPVESDLRSRQMYDWKILKVADITVCIYLQQMSSTPILSKKLWPLIDTATVSLYYCITPKQVVKKKPEVWSKTSPSVVFSLKPLWCYFSG